MSLGWDLMGLGERFQGADFCVQAAVHLGGGLRDGIVDVKRM